MRVRGCDLIWTPRELEDEEDTSESEDDEEDTSESEDDDKCKSVAIRNTSTVPVEIPTSINIPASPYAYFEGKRDIHQLVATSVVCSFTEYRLEQSNSMMATVLINCNMFRICLYDCVSDVLLLSDPL